MFKEGWISIAQLGERTRLFTSDVLVRLYSNIIVWWFRGGQSTFCHGPGKCPVCQMTSPPLDTTQEPTKTTQVSLLQIQANLHLRLSPESLTGSESTIYSLYSTRLTLQPFVHEKPALGSLLLNICTP